MIPEIQEYLDRVALDKTNATAVSYRKSLEKLVHFLKAETFEDLKKITPSDARKFQTSLAKSGVANSSNNSYILNIKVFYNYLVKIEEIKESPFGSLDKLKVNNKNLTWLSDEEQVAMFDACDDLEEKTILAMLIGLGLRRSELVNLKVIDVVGNKVTVLGKGKKFRTVFFPPDVYELYLYYMSTRKHQDFEYIFRSKENRAYHPESIRRKIKKICELAGFSAERIAEISTHTMRRTCATNLVSNNVSPNIIQGILGHADIATTMKYANLRPSAIEEAMGNQRPILKKE